MIRRTLTTTSLILALGNSIATGGLRYQVSGASSPQDKLLAKRAAELDAYRMLAERVIGLQLTSTTSVRDFITESDVIATRVKAFLKGARIVQTRVFQDGTCEVDMEITLQSVVTQLKRIHREHYRGGKFTSSDFEQIQKYHRNRVISATGSGAPRTRRTHDPFDDLRGDNSPKARAERPAIWKTFTPQQRLMAKRAALLDAYRRMAERIHGLRLDSKTTVRDFVTQEDEIRTAVNAFLRGAREIDTRYTPDGVVEVDVAVTLEQIITTLKRIQSECRTGSRIRRYDFESLRKHTQRKIITATGMGVPGKKRFHPDQQASSETDNEADATTVIIEGETAIVVE